MLDDNVPWRWDDELELQEELLLRINFKIRVLLVPKHPPLLLQFLPRM
jgi:hypothetical protein